MRGWMAANLFLAGMAVFAAALLFGGFSAVRWTGLSQGATSAATGCVSIASLFITGYVFRIALRWFERRR
jgi:hypothetical protein